MKLDSTIVCLVTGGASGLGLATVKLLLEKGCKVVMADFNEELGNKFVQDSRTANVKFFKTDVTNEENVIQLIKFTVAQFGGIHIVVNCAGIISAGMIVNSKGDTVKNVDIEKVFRVNVFGTINVCKHAAAAMIKQEPIGEFKERGVLINVASLAGIEGQRGQLAYGGSKGAVIGMTLPMARDIGKFGIRVVALAPGIIETPMAAHVSDKILQEINKSTALNRVGQASEFAEAVVGICTCSYINGTVIRLDGGVRLPHL